MNMQQARRILHEALEMGLTLHGISASGRPAISFDYSNPQAEAARRCFNATSGLIRELLRAAMIEECQNRGLPQDLPLSFNQTMEQDMQDARLAIVH